MKKLIYCPLLLFLLMVSCSQEKFVKEPTLDNGEYFWLEKRDLRSGKYHQQHSKIFGKYVTGYNDFILKGIDKAQSTAMQGGGYFTGITAKPTESPIGYQLKLLGKPLLDPPRTTSYCSGVSYTAFIEGLNLIYQDLKSGLDSLHYEAMRMQEIDGSRRNDGVKFWGHWNADGLGSHFALVQYSKMGKEIKPENLRPGDFVNISWKSGLGHSVVFMGWYQDTNNKKYMLYWSSQESTNGMADQKVAIDKIKEIKAVRLTNPDKLFDFDVTREVNTEIPGNKIQF
ncbi:MAG TPA: hypothetical protein VKP78_08340 [bacterium]|nr:hypothetical protein [bacterium]